MSYTLKSPDNDRMISFAHVFLRLAVTFAVVIFSHHPSDAQQNNKATILAINDVYRLMGTNSGKNGGMPRVRSLRAELERDVPDLLFLHAGDFLSPSFLGRTYKGAQMIDLMNIMDGDPTEGSHDPRMFVAFGNHEFDDSHCSKSGPLAKLVSSSEFTWLASNLEFDKCELLAPLAAAQNVVDTRIVEAGGLKIGLYGLTISRSKYEAIVSDPLKRSCERVAALRAQDVDAVVALTHLPWKTDLKILGLDPAGKPLAAAGNQSCKEVPDIVVGGHDHLSMALPTANPRLFKADSDATSAWVIELAKQSDGTIDVKARLEELDQSRQRDPLAERLAHQWLLRHDERFCALDCRNKKGNDLKLCLGLIQNGGCLTQEIARSDGLIETEEIANRSSETGFGNWVADRVRVAGNAEVSFINSGAIRLNYNLEKGTVITRRHMEEMFPFKNKLVIRNITGADLWKAVEQSVKKRGEGAWAHFSGMAVRLRSGNGEQQVDQISVRRLNGSVVEITPDSEEPVRVASLSFVLANGDKHGFKLCPETMDMWACKDDLEAAPDWPATGSGSDLAEFVRINLQSSESDQGLQFPIDGRLCDPQQDDCLIDRW